MPRLTRHGISDLFRSVKHRRVSDSRCADPGDGSGIPAIIGENRTSVRMLHGGGITETTVGPPGGYSTREESLRPR
ncbi:hypothetical protein RRG08_043375 [Elysia crispata]|uniref:Uncharacterized protein n=1 Tax=Elysia crispata TaxID=231223 RepID=A0AAE0Z549_9GAST|nr:hypothetical protein RRG08_043375 [Elysia crispata]